MNNILVNIMHKYEMKYGLEDMHKSICGKKTTKITCFKSFFFVRLEHCSILIGREINA